MTDIVERLRDEAEWYFNAAWIRQDGGNDYRLSGRLADEAADEIERLREALKQVGLYAWQGDTFKIMDIVRETIIGKEK